MNGNRKSPKQASFCLFYGRAMSYFVPGGETDLMFFLLTGISVINGCGGGGLENGGEIYTHTLEFLIISNLMRLALEKIRTTGLKI